MQITEVARWLVVHNKRTFKWKIALELARVTYDKILKLFQVETYLKFKPISHLDLFPI